MASSIQRLTFALQMFFVLKNVWLTLSACGYYGLISLWNAHGCFPLFHNDIKKLCIVT